MGAEPCYSKMNMTGGNAFDTQLCVVNRSYVWTLFKETASVTLVLIGILGNV